MYLKQINHLIFSRRIADPGVVFERSQAAAFLWIKSRRGKAECSFEERCQHPVSGCPKRKLEGERSYRGAFGGTTFTGEIPIGERGLIVAQSEKAPFMLEWVLTYLHSKRSGLSLEEILSRVITAV
ncbi:hypothetical protein Ancab_001944 [Ancistrocladus abbreviatus]